MFVVVRMGIYDQGVVGVHTDLDKAKRIAELAAAKERDAYHDFEIRVRTDGHEFDEMIWNFTAGGPVRHRGHRREWEEGG